MRLDRSHPLVLPRRLALPLVLVLACLLAAPTIAFGCTFPFRKVGPVNIGPRDIRTPVSARGRAATWKVPTTWASVDPIMSQYVQIRNGKRFFGSAFAGQTTLTIDAFGPQDFNWLYVDDEDPATAPCKLLGRNAWTNPRILVRETRARVFVAAVSAPTPGDNTGCILGPDYGTRACPLLTRRVMRLKRPIGARKIVFERWGRIPGDAEPLTPARPVRR